ncbi:MAG: tandem-95 repeat protein [Candidatus Marinimicrobia bacterium]|nr:tandem-95 repeat protein [Candidatus Neomarinimicrobiota bacterium]
MTFLTPSSGPIGTFVYIHGMGFSTTASENSVTVGGELATISEASDNRLKIIIPNLISGEKWVTLSVNNSVADSLFPLTVIPWGIGPVTFGPQQLVTNQVDGNIDVYACDIDGDGDNDILSASYIDHKVAWYENTDGSGTFGPQQIIFDLIYDGQAVTAGDIDGDGDMDVLSASGGNNTVAWYENTDGLGSFGGQIIITNQTNWPTDVFSIDLDGDGDIDVLSASHWDNKIAWYENTDGNGTFGPQQIISSQAIGAQSVFAADIDGDVDIDVLSASHTDNKVAWYENLDGLGTFGNEQIITLLTIGVEQVITADIDGDGDQDALSASNDSKIAWYENTDGLGTFGPQLIITDQAIDALAVWTADLDSDGDQDVLSASINDFKVAWYENTNGLGIFGPQQIISILPGAYSIHTSDLDGDWDQDIIAGTFSDDKIIIHKNTTQQNEAPIQPILWGAIHGDKSIELNWSLSAENDYSKYNIYRGNSVTVDSLITEITNLQDTTYIDTGLTNGIRYFYNVSVVDTFGLESSRSNIVSTVPNRAPDWLLGDTLIFTEDEIRMFALDSILFDDSDPLDSIQITLVSGANHFALSVDHPNSILALIPGENYYGESTLALQAEDPSGDSRIDTIVAMVQPVNDPPVLPPDTVLQAIEDTVFAYHPHASDVDGDPLSYNVSALPSWLSFSGDSLFGIANGTDTDTIVFITTNDGTVSDTQRVVIQLTYVNDTPLITEPFSDINLPLPTSPVLIQDSLEYHFWDEEDGRNLIFQAVSPTTTIDSVVIQISGELHQIWLYAPSDLRTVVDVEITARDSGQASVSDTFMVFFGYESGQPIITAMEDTVILEDHDLDLPVHAYDREGDDLSWTVEMDTLAVMATLSGDTLLHIHPQPNWWGQTTLEVRVSDGALIDSTVFSLTIQPVNDPPVLTVLPDTVMNEDGILLLMVEGLDVENDFLTYGMLESGIFTVQMEANVATIIPAADLYGADSIRFTVSDSENEDSTWVRITVLPVNDAPEVILPFPDVAVDEDAFGAVLVDRLEDYFDDVDLTDSLFFAAQSPDEGLDSLVILTDGQVTTFRQEGIHIRNAYHKTGWIGQVADSRKIFKLVGNGNQRRVLGGSRQVVARSLVIYPSLNFTGDVQVIVIATDKENASVRDTMLVTIQPINDSPELSALPDTVMNEDEILNIPIDYQDPDDSTLTFETTVGDTSIQVVINPQLIQIQPGSNWYGNSWITWSVSDKEYTRFDSFSIVILPENDRPHIAVNWEEEPITGQTSFRLTYHDDDLDTLTFQGEFSYDSEITWHPIILAETNNSLNPSSPSRIFTWNSTHFFANTDKYWGIYDQVVFRLWANDLVLSSDTITVTKSLLNLAGDYNENQEMDAGDIGCLLKAYYGRGDTITANDIGPSSGEEPYLISDPDSVINFEDLATFSQTWYYDAQNGARIATRKSAIGYPEIELNPNSIWSIQKYGRSDNENLETVDVVLVPVIDLSQYNGMDIDLFYDNQKWPELMISSTLKSLPPNQIVLWKQEVKSGYFKLSVFSNNRSLNNSGNQPVLIQFPRNGHSLPDHLILSVSTTLYASGYSTEKYSEQISFDNSMLLPQEFALHQNFPNPFNPRTTIHYDLPEDGFVKLSVYDITGRLIVTLVNENQEAGYRSTRWDGKNSAGTSISTGMYLCVLKAGSHTATRKMLLLK